MRKPVLVLLFLLLPSLAFAQNKIAVRPIGQSILSFSATPVFDAGMSSTFKIILTANVTSSTVIGMEAGQELTFEVCQDGVGARTFAWPALMVGPIAILAGANVCTVETFHYDGTSAYIWTTTTSGGGGAGTVAAGTQGHYGYYGANGTTISSNANLDDGILNALALTYSGANGMFASMFSSTSSGAGLVAGTNSTCSGAAIGKSVICAGDSTSSTAQVSNNGDSFRSFATHQSTSPTVHGIMLSETFPLMFAAPRGTQGQAFLEGASAGDPGFGQLDLSLPTNITNRLPKTNQTSTTVYNDQVNTFAAAGSLDLSSSTVASAFRVPIGAGLTTTLNGAHGYDTTSHNHHLGTNGADSRIAIWTGSAPVHHDCVWFTNVSGHVEIADSLTTCGGGSTPRLDQVTSATNPWTTTNGDNPLSLQFAATTSGRTSVEITESAAATSGGTPFLLNVHTLAASTHNPCIFTARGTANGIRCDAATGSLSALGTANINSTQINGVSVTGTPGVGQIPVASSPTAATWADPIVSFNYVNLWTAQDVTVTRTSAAVRNPIYSQTGTLQITWASITGSPATCTLQIQGVDSVGNVLNNGSTFSVSPANGTSSQSFTAASTLQSAAQVKAIFACVTYPTTGTLTLDYTPIPNVNVTNTVAVSAASLPLPGGAATAAKQPALGTAGTASADVITVQGIASMTALKVDASATTQPVSGTVTAAQTVGANLETVHVATATTTNAALESAIVTAASTNATSVKGSAGNLYGFEIYNTTTTIYYLRLYNLATAPTCSSATGFIRSIPIVPASAAGQASGQISNFGVPIGYSTGIAYCITGGSSSTDNTNAAVGVFGALRYK